MAKQLDFSMFYKKALSDLHIHKLPRLNLIRHKIYSYKTVCRKYTCLIFDNDTWDNYSLALRRVMHLIFNTLVYRDLQEYTQLG